MHLSCWQKLMVKIDLHSVWLGWCYTSSDKSRLDCKICEHYVQNIMFEITLFVIITTAQLMNKRQKCIQYFRSVYVLMKHFVFYNVAIMEYILQTNQVKSSQVWDDVATRAFVALAVV